MIYDIAQIELSHSLKITYLSHFELAGGLRGQSRLEQFQSPELSLGETILIAVLTYFGWLWIYSWRITII